MRIEILLRQRLALQLQFPSRSAACVVSVHAANSLVQFTVIVQFETLEPEAIGIEPSLS